MRTVIARVLAAAVALCGAAGVAEAGLGARNGEIGIDAGYVRFDRNVSDTGAGRFSLRGGYCLTKLFELEGQALGIASVESGSSVDLTTGLGASFVNAVFNLHPSNPGIVPYLLAGVGWATLTFDFDPGPDVDDSSAAWQAAAGSRFFFGASKRVAVRVEVSVIGENTFDRSSTHVGAAAGFTWRLGQPRP